MSQLLAFLLAFHNRGFLLGAIPTEAQEERLICLNDYLVTINCSLSTFTDPLHTENTSYSLEFERDDRKKFKCLLEKKVDHYYCTFNSSDRFIDTERFKVTLHYKTNEHKKFTLIDKYRPVHHIKPCTPYNLTVQMNSDGYRLTWNSGYETVQPSVFLVKNLKYKVKYYKTGHPDKQVEMHTVNKTFHIDDINLEANTEYTAKICSSPDQLRYKGQWSEWSPVVQWRTNAQKVAGGVLLIGQLALPVCLITGLLACLCFNLVKRLRMKAYSNLPNPAPFFQPLYSNYKGDFRSWLMSQGSLEMPLKFEEFSKVDAVTEPKSNVEQIVIPLPPQASQCHATYVNPCVYACDSVHRDCLHSPLSLPFLKASLKEMSSQSLDTAGKKEDCSPPKDLVLWPLGDVPSEPESMCYNDQYCTLSQTRSDLISTNLLKQAYSNTSEDNRKHVYDGDPQVEG